MRIKACFLTIYKMNTKKTATVIRSGFLYVNLLIKR